MDSSLGSGAVAAEVKASTGAESGATGSEEDAGGEESASAASVEAALSSSAVGKSEGLPEARKARRDFRNRRGKPIEARVSSDGMA